MGSRRAILAQAISVQDGIAHACSSVLWLVCIDKLRQCMGAKQEMGCRRQSFRRSSVTSCSHRQVCEASGSCDAVFTEEGERQGTESNQRVPFRAQPRCRTRRQRRRRAESPCLPTRSWPQRGRESRKSRRQIWRWEKAMTCSLFSRMKKAQAQAQERPVSERIVRTHPCHQVVLGEEEEG